MYYPEEKNEFFIFMFKYIQNDMQFYSMIYTVEIRIRILNITTY